MLVREAMPFYKLWVEIEKTYTRGDGYLDKLCMELVGLDSSAAAGRRRATSARATASAAGTCCSRPASRA